MNLLWIRICCDLRSNLYEFRVNMVHTNGCYSAREWYATSHRSRPYLSWLPMARLPCLPWLAVPCPLCGLLGPSIRPIILTLGTLAAAATQARVFSPLRLACTSNSDCTCSRTLANGLLGLLGCNRNRTSPSGEASPLLVASPTSIHACVIASKNHTPSGWMVVGGGLCRNSCSSRCCCRYVAACAFASAQTG